MLLADPPNIVLSYIKKNCQKNNKKYLGVGHPTREFYILDWNKKKSTANKRSELKREKLKVNVCTYT